LPVIDASFRFEASANDFFQGKCERGTETGRCCHDCWEEGTCSEEGLETEDEDWVYDVQVSEFVRSYAAYFFDCVETLFQLLLLGMVRGSRG
jgi:hypothetical protein